MAGVVRQPINVKSLEAYIDKNVPSIRNPLKIQQFGFGQSNPTYKLTDANGNSFVLRKKPPGKLLSKTAHKVEREYRIIEALQNTDVPVPKVFGLCRDEEILGTPFYIMSFLDGRIFENHALPGVTPAERQEMWHEAIRVLARLHNVKPNDVNLNTFGRSSGFYNRQIATFQAVSESQARAVDVDSQNSVGKIPHFDEMLDFFRDAHMQPEDRNAIVHGDYKIDNLVFHKTEARIIGILDWEMSTLGHPLSDLSNLLQPYTIAASEAASNFPSAQAGFGHNKAAGLPSKADCIKWYAQHAGWDPTLDISWSASFDLCRACLIIQGIAARSALRQASSERAHEYIERLPAMAEYAWSLVQRANHTSDGPSRSKPKL